MENLKEKEAELVGIILGDGHLAPKPTWTIVITCGKIDWKYIHEFVPNLMRKLFSRDPKFYHIWHNGFAIQCRLNSKSASTHLVNTYGLKHGKKINIKIPRILFKNKKNLRACIRGLIDTDGGIYRHHKKSIQIVFNNNEFSLINSLFKALTFLGYKPKISKEKVRQGKYKLYLFTEDSKKYYEEIGFNNPKNNIKFEHWLKYGNIPNHSEIEDIMTEIREKIPVLAKKYVSPSYKKSHNIIIK
jgi:hypothetical protein